MEGESLRSRTLIEIDKGIVLDKNIELWAIV